MLARKGRRPKVRLLVLLLLRKAIWKVEELLWVPHRHLAHDFSLGRFLMRCWIWLFMSCRWRACSYRVQGP